MQTDITPMNEMPINSKEILINTNQLEEQNKQKNIDVDRYFVEKPSPSDNSFTITFLCYRILIITFSIIVLIPCTVTPLCLKNLDMSSKLLFISSGIIFTLVLLILSNNKLIIIRDTSNKKVIIKVINFLCCTKNKIVLDIENTHFYINTDINPGEGSDPTYLYVKDDYKNLERLDSDTSDIKWKPIKIFYKFKNITTSKFGDLHLTNELNSFISGTKIENPSNFIFRIRMNTKIKYNFFLPSGCAKLHEHLFTFHFKNPYHHTCLESFVCCFIGFLNFMAIQAVIALLVLFGKDILSIILILSSLIVSNVIYYIMYRCLKLCFEKIYRIDFVYSRNFDRIFIGIVKYTKTSYINTFDFNMNDIESFILEKEGNNESYNLKVVFKNKDTQQICRMKNKKKNELNDLAYFLN